MTKQASKLTSSRALDVESKTKTQRQEKVERWRCLNCGQQIFVSSVQNPPDVCQFCADMTTWESVGA